MNTRFSHFLRRPNQMIPAVVIRLNRKSGTGSGETKRGPYDAIADLAPGERQRQAEQ